MAVSEIKNPSSLKIKLNLGLVDGKAKTRSKSYYYIKNEFIFLWSKTPFLLPLFFL